MNGGAVKHRVCGSLHAPDANGAGHTRGHTNGRGRRGGVDTVSPVCGKFWAAWLSRLMLDEGFWCETEELLRAV